jgi:hypothetical protein
VEVQKYVNVLGTQAGTADGDDRISLVQGR